MVILDDGLRSLISHVDEGYAEHQVLRQQLHHYWKQYHNFSGVTEFRAGLLLKK